MIQVSKRLAIRSERLAGSWTHYRVWCELDGKPYGWSTETDDPHTAELQAANTLRKSMGLPSENADEAASMVLGVLMSPWLWFGLLGMALAGLL